MKWFENKGIRQTNPDDIIRCPRDTLRATLTNKIRKLSLPDEKSCLLQRRCKGANNIYVWSFLILCLNICVTYQNKPRPPKKGVSLIFLIPRFNRHYIKFKYYLNIFHWINGRILQKVLPSNKILEEIYF